MRPTSVSPSECSLTDAIVAANAGTESSMSGIGGAVGGSAKYEGQSRRSVSSDSSAVAVPASSFASTSPTHARCASVRGASSRLPNSSITSR